MPRHLSSPSHSFSIPSIYDGVRLDCRVYIPHHLQNSDKSSQLHMRGAIVAHPYAPLGGCFDDPVVSFVGGELLDAGYVVGTFNFRGAGESEGRTSWTGKPELGDYVSFYGFMLFYLNFLKLNHASPQSGDGDTGKSSIHIILGGYSYGSIIAQHLPASNLVLDLFKAGAQGTPIHEIFTTAKAVWTRSDGNSPVPEQPPNSDTSSPIQSAKEILDSSIATISYLLVSPVLPPVNLFLTLFSHLSLEVGSGSHVPGQRRHIPCPRRSDHLRAQRSLVIYGDEDTFTSVSKYRKWADELASAPQSQFLSVEVSGADHFWREDGVESQARRFLREWLRQQR